MDFGDVILSKETFDRINIPDDFRVTDVTKIPPSVRSTVSTYLTNLIGMRTKGVGLMLIGPAGVGKSSIACFIAKHAAKSGFKVYYTEVYELRDAVRNKAIFEDTVTVLDRCKDVDFLVLDRLTVEDATAPIFNAGDLASLVGYRVSRRRPTLITTQLDRRSIYDRFPALAERTTGSAPWVVVEGPNFNHQRAERLEAFFNGKQDSL